MKVFVFELVLHNACGLDSGSQNVLDSGDVAVVSYPLQTVQIAGRDGEREGEREREEGRQREGERKGG